MIILFHSYLVYNGFVYSSRIIFITVTNYNSSIWVFGGSFMGSRPKLCNLIFRLTLKYDSCCAIFRMFRPPKLIPTSIPRPAGVRLLQWSEITKVRELGIGAFSSVALYTTSNDELLAVKTFRRDVPTKKIIKEAGILLTLKHENVVQLLACSVTDPIAIMLEYVYYDMALHGIDMHISCLQNLMEEFDKSNFNQLRTYSNVCIQGTGRRSALPS